MWYSCAEFQHYKEDDVRKGMILAFGLVLLAGCGNQGNKSSSVPAEPKWKGAPYRLTLDTKANDTKANDTKANNAKVNKPNPAAIIPPVKYTANPDALETRAVLVIRFAATTGSDQDSHLIIGTPLDVRGANGTLPADYLERASKGLSDYLAARCIQGNVKISVALARSSLKPQANDAEVDAERLSDWVPFEAVFKKPHSKC
jgi:hypothetical protein